MINICETCRHRHKRKDQEPCKGCCTEIGINWEPKEWEPKEEKKENRPKPLPLPVYNYERDSSRIPDSVRVCFDDGTTAVYPLRVDQPKPLVMESIRIIRKWRSEGYQYMPPRRRRSRK